MDDNKYDGCGVINISRGSRWSPYVQYQNQMNKLLEGLDKSINSMVTETKRAEREYIRLLLKYDSDLVNKIISMTSCSIFDVEEYINRVQFTKDGLVMFDLDSLSDLHFESLTQQPSIETQITNLKSQLKHCKNPLQKLNTEREMNRLIRERKEIEYVQQRR